MASKLTSDALNQILAAAPPGVWIWKLDQIDPGYLDKLVAAGCRRVYLKVFDDLNGPILYPGTNEIPKFVAKGISVVGWGYHFDGRQQIDIAAEAAVVKQAMALGLDGYIADLEKEIESSSVYSQVRDLLVHLRDSVGSQKFLGYTTFGYPPGHPNIPWRILDEVTDIAFPQIYFEDWRHSSWGKNDADRIRICLQAHADLGLKNPILPVWGSEAGVAAPATKEDLQPLLAQFPGSSVFRIPQGKEAGVAWDLDYTPGAKPLPTPTPAPEPEPEPAPVAAESLHTFEQMVTIGMRVSGRFEGDDPWANITGNSDDQGLTCGMLGKTFAAGDQQPLIRQFLDKFGAGALMKLMPQTGADYIRFSSLPKADGTKAVIPWSVNGTSSRVRQPYLDELRAFWKSPQMVAIQFKAAILNEGKFASDHAAAWGLSDSLRAFCFFFDIATQGGSLKGLGPEDVEKFFQERGSSAAACQEACVKCEGAEAFRANSGDAHRNGQLWAKNLNNADDITRRLFALGWLRSELSLQKYVYTAMNRRGSLAMGQGYVNESFWDLREDFNLLSPSSIPVATVVVNGNSAPPKPAMPSTAGPADGKSMKVAVSTLNLRKTPGNTDNSNIMVSLPNGQLVQVLDSSRTDGWWKVNANFRNDLIEGYVASRYLSSATTVAAPSATGIVAVHLSASAKLNQPANAHPLDEPSAPRLTSDTPSGRCADLARIISFLDVKRSRRYRPDEVTYCNIYAYDYCYLADVYLPRVWWLDSALQKLAHNQPVVPEFQKTVDEMRANDIEVWFDQFGSTFGWKHTLDPDELQSVANQGGIGIIVARNRVDSASGHIVVVPPELPDQKAKRSGGKVVVPLQSQAGRINFPYGMGRNGTAWWTTSEYRAFGLWYHV